MKSSLVLIVVGILSIIAGVIALVFPLPASLTLNAFVGSSLIVGGILGVIASFQAGARADRIWGILLGLAVLALGAILLFNPIAGLATLTMVFAIGFLVSGVIKLVLGFGIDVPAWKWSLILSGLISIVLAIMIFTGWPQSSAVVPGILLAVELLTYGWGIMFLGLAWRRTERA